MVPLAELWLPILLSAVFVFVASSVIHMATPMHKRDFKPLPNEDAVREAMRNAGVAPGAWAFPCPASMQDMGSPEFVQKYTEGPVGFMQILPNGPPKMGKSLVQWFLWSLVLSVFIAYLTGLAAGPGESYMVVFRIAGTVGVLGYAFSNVTNSIWKGESWWTTFKFMLDGAIYGLVSAGTFAWQWPGVAG
ncbi:MAG: hypothetical protein DRQ55_04335 [Planctomycetota bacterium]|nr:MAG: hypothetical protein DRQ55_04335 [Planctomycetota bacterium]